MSRPERLVLVTGTGTEIGKTWWTAATARDLRNRGVAVAARKPTQSFAPDDESTDAELLGAATGEDPETVCPHHRWYPTPMAPPMAADVLGAPPFEIADLAAELTWPAGCAVGFVESVGGPLSPLAADGDTVDLADALTPTLTVLVADAGLGTVNDVRLCAGVLGTPLLVALNHFEADADLHRRNRAWLAERYDVVVDPAELANRLTARTGP